MPSIDIVIPVHNGGRLVEETLRSTLGHISDTTRVLVFDNNSTDESLLFLDNVTFDRVHQFHSPTTLSMAESWTRACSFATAEWVLLLPGDDLLAANFSSSYEWAISTLERTLNLSNIAAIYSPRKLLGSSETSRFAALVSTRLRTRNRNALSEVRTLAIAPELVAFQAAGPDFFRLVKRRGGNFMGEPGCVLIRRDALTQSLPWSDKYPYVIDLDMWSRIASFGELVLFDTYCCNFRLHSMQSTKKLQSKQCSDLRNWFLEAQLGKGEEIVSSSGAFRSRLWFDAWLRRFVHAILE